jgi:hypothetical protein
MGIYQIPAGPFNRHDKFRFGYPMMIKNVQLQSSNTRTETVKKCMCCIYFVAFLKILGVSGV